MIICTEERGDCFFEDFCCGYSLRILDITNSTNVDAWHFMSKRTTQVPFWVMSRQQRCGKGRNGRSWISGEGDLMASLVISCDNHDARLMLISAVASLSIADTVISCGVPACDVEVKWPNDVLVKRKKIAGVLTEIKAHTDGRSMCAVVGIGINLRNPSDRNIHDFMWGRSSIEEASGNRITPEEVLYTLTHSFNKYFTLWKSKEYEYLCNLWQSSMAMLGEIVTVKDKEYDIRGIFKGIDYDGAMLLNIDEHNKDKEPVRVIVGDLCLQLGYAQC